MFRCSLINFGFPKTYKLLNSSDFSPIFANPVIKVHHSQFLILAIFNPYSHPRLGIIIGKKNVRLAVNRNRIKRLARESFRNKQHNLPPIDAIVLARRGSEQLSNDDILEILDSLWSRAAEKAMTIKLRDTPVS